MFSRWAKNKICEGCSSAKLLFITTEAEILKERSWPSDENLLNQFEFLKSLSWMENKPIYVTNVLFERIIM